MILLLSSPVDVAAQGVDSSSRVLRLLKHFFFRRQKQQQSQPQRQQSTQHTYAQEPPFCWIADSAQRVVLPFSPQEIWSHNSHSRAMRDDDARINELGVGGVEECEVTSISTTRTRVHADTRESDQINKHHGRFAIVIPPVRAEDQPAKQGTTASPPNRPQTLQDRRNMYE